MKKPNAEKVKEDVTVDKERVWALLLLFIRKLVTFSVITHLPFLPWIYYSTQFWFFICEANGWCLASI